MRRLFLIALAALPFCVRAQEHTFSVEADYLSRGEIRDGGILVKDDEEDPEALKSRFVLSRTRLGASYSHEWLSARLTAQHADTWGSSAGNSLSMNEAWVKAQLPVGFFAQIGRQRLSYDDQRIFGADDWSMTGYSHDGLKLGFERAGHKVHLFGAYNQDVANIDEGGTRFTGGIQPYKSLASVWYHCDIPKTNIGASLLFVNMGLEFMDVGEEDAYVTCFQQLAGTFLSWKPKYFGMEASYYHQWGKAYGGIPLNAWMASAKALVTPSEQWQMRVGYDYLSGEEDFPIPGEGHIGLVRHEIVRGFNSLYGSNHRFYGAMDFFYVSTYVNGFTPGLQNLYAGVTWTPAKSFSADAAYHYFATAAPVKDAKRSLGHEVEMELTWSIAPSVSLSAGYSFMQGTDTMAVLKRTSKNNRLQWGWLMLNVTPTFFKGKW